MRIATLPRGSRIVACVATNIAKAVKEKPGDVTAGTLGVVVRWRERGGRIDVRNRAKTQPLNRDQIQRVVRTEDTDPRHLTDPPKTRYRWDTDRAKKAGTRQSHGNAKGAPRPKPEFSLQQLPKMRPGEILGSDDLGIKKPLLKVGGIGKRQDVGHGPEFL